MSDTSEIARPANSVPELRAGADRVLPGMRGLPPGLGPLSISEIKERRWHPARGEMSLPVLTMDLEAFGNNAKVMQRIAGHYGAWLAPHGKTPMAPAIAGRLLEFGSWATSVADLRQAEVMLAAGHRRVIIANQIGGLRALERLAQLLDRYGDADVYLFVDTAETIKGLERLWLARPSLPTIKLLVEVSCGRGGAHEVEQIQAIVDACSGAAPGVQLAGIAAYEGTLMRPTEQETLAGLDEFFARIAKAVSLVALASSQFELILTAGGSSLFDQVIVRALPLLQGDRRIRLVLRSGACYFSDHGGIARRLEALVSRAALAPVLGKTNPFQPVLRLWAEVLTHNAAGQAICGLGLRDTSHDQGPPVPLRIWRDGALLAEIAGSATVEKLNDQHAFVSHIGNVDMRIGDVVEFGISHPCTCLDKHSVVYGLGASGLIETAFLTQFG